MTKQRLNILVVEDDPGNRELLTTILEQEGHTVTCCKNGLEAIHWCFGKHDRLDVVLMDILMPIMDGIEAARLLKANPGTARLPIVCVSAKSSFSDPKSLARAGFDRVLTKPFKRQELIQAVEDAIRVKPEPGR